MAVSYSIHVNGAELDSQVGAIAYRRCARVSRRIATQARQDVPVRTGNLGRQIGEGPVRMIGPRTAHGSVHDMADYALYVHEPTRPHLIRPRNAQALRFQVGGRTVITKLVRHPGGKGRPFLRNAGLRVAAQEAAG